MQLVTDFWIAAKLILLARFPQCTLSKGSGRTLQNTAAIIDLFLKFLFNINHMPNDFASGKDLRMGNER